MALEPLPGYVSGLESRIIAKVTAETEGALTDLKNDAETAAAAATAAVGAVLQTAEALADNADGIEEGGYYGALGIPVATEYTRFYARVLTGTGTASVTVLDDGYPVHGPVTVGTTATDATIAVTMAVGSEVSFFIEDVTGTVTALYAKIEGLPA